MTKMHQGSKTTVPSTAAVYNSHQAHRETVEDELVLIAETMELQAHPPYAGNQSALVSKSSGFYNPGLDPVVLKGLCCDLNVIADACRLAAEGITQFRKTNKSLYAQAAAYAINGLCHAFEERNLRTPPTLKQAHRVLCELCESRNKKIKRHMRIADRADLGSIQEWRSRLKTDLKITGSCQAQPGVSVSVSKINNEVLRARELLDGRVLVLVGGEHDPEREKALSEAFDCEVRQVKLQHHKSARHLSSFLNDPLVAVVAVLIKNTKHETRPAVVKMCNRFGKVAITITAGFSSNQLARAILSQADKRLSDPTKAA